MSIPLLVLQWPATLEEPQSETVFAIEEGETWMTPLVRYLENDILLEDRMEARKNKEASRKIMYLPGEAIPEILLRRVFEMCYTSRSRYIRFRDRTSTSTNYTTITSANDTTSTSIDSTNSETIDNTSAAIDTDFCHRSIPLKIPERSSCPQDIADSTLKSIDISSCDPTSDGDREITMEDFLELRVLGVGGWRKA
ncbi:hypothetical protein F2Q70_00004351 [Brassica cretica]|uniref:Uncharacterized protein n=1 Tax=Brassica cretica TaxID=69181 RepID=A0A8S9IWS2_BRACR|nr:hypothetical protein F2Q70_00004351 [Brassica cretica]